ncbi:hypothetical protein ACH4ZX_36650 [Streptomyces sp. NPDC020490]|uniref:hypothetical protein n=1 Tax=Streptomyces sp. NPDC020490 TaxID=3365078 RepID=UPI00379CCCAC
MDDDGAGTLPARSRRSATDSLLALGAGPPGLPPAPAHPPTTATVVRSEGLVDGDDGDGDGDDPQEPGLAALGLAATLAIALAALRGTATVLHDWRQRRMERAEELAPLREARLKHKLAGEEAAAKHALAMQGIGDKAAQKRSKIPSSQEYGRKALASGRSSLGSGGGKSSGSSGGRGTGTGPGRGTKSGTTGTGPGAKTSPGKSGGGKTSTGTGSAGTGKGGKNGSGAGIKSLSGGKSPSSKASSPALERARGRQERAAARQGAKSQRRADRQAARLENRAKDHDAARDRKHAEKEARQAAKGKVRNARIEAKGDRKEKARDARFEAKQQQREARAEARRKKTEKAAATDAGRTTLGQAAAKAARRRLKKRRKNLAPPILSTVKKRKKKPEPGATSSGAAAGTGTGTATSPKKPTGPKGPRAKKKHRFKKPNAKAGTKPTTSTSSTSSAGAPSTGPTGTSSTGSAGTSSTGPGGTFSGRRSAYDSMRDTDPSRQTVYRVESLHVPGAQARRWEPAAVTAGTPPPPAAPVGTSPTTKGVRVSASPVSIPTPRATVSAEHLTEVTLDDVLDALADSKDECLTTYDECAVLADKAVKIRNSLRELAVELAERNNVIGRLTSAAMNRLAESMDLLKKKAEDMRKESLAASEAVETAHDEMHDAYRPVQHAALDAGLTMPSARIHNED